VALKMALQYWHNKGQIEKHRFVTIRGGYHGDTFGAMSVCDPDNGMHHLFSGVLPKHFFVKSPSMVPMDEALQDLESTLKQNANSIAAMILEPVVQGAGGMRIYNPQYLTQAKALCEQFDVLFILDEIATGFGRTGELFALEYVDVTPDILCLGILGAIAVIEMKEEIRVEWMQKRLIELGAWLRPYGKLLYAMPPFVITDDELITITKAIKIVVAES